MVLRKIENLLKKYELGETNLNEEAELKTFFQKSEIPDHLKVYKQLFNSFSTAGLDTYKKKILIPKKNHKIQWFSMAAAAALILGIFLGTNFNNGTKELTNENLLTYNQTKSAIEMLSRNINKGTSKLKTLQIISNSYGKGKQNLTILNNFNTSTHKIFKLKN
ncbi:MAG: hypothetical protein CMP78_04095 [Formosa sp.]|jgi:hypothetical protein|nr:hypothetical protein [Formosa sp.]